MLVVIEAGSDMASLCLFDPAALTPDFQQRPAREQRKLVDTLVGTEAALRILTGGDGSFHVHVYLDEAPPEHPGELIGNKPMVTSSGCFCLTGEEDIRPGDAESFGQSALRLPPGKYSVKSWRIPQAEGAEEAAFEKRVIAEVGPEAWARSTRRSRYGVFMVIALILCGVFCGLATLSRTGRNYFGWPGLVGLWLGWLALIQIVPRLMLSTQDEKIARIMLEARKDFPAYIIYLTRA
jgi:drug/metabolite transporter superfamily protein YnfA